MMASYKFIQKLFTLHEKINEISKFNKTNTSNELSKFINQYLFKSEKNLSNFHYNVIIANIYEAYSFFTKIIKDKKNYSNLASDYTKFLISISPVIPHFTNECLDQLNAKKDNWPKIEENFLIEENVNIVIQLNGKKRGIFEAKKDIPEKELVIKIMENKNFDKLLKDSKVKKQFYVKNRLINFII